MKMLVDNNENIAHSYQQVFFQTNLENFVETWTTIALNKLKVLEGEKMSRILEKSERRIVSGCC